MADKRRETFIQTYMRIYNAGGTYADLQRATGSSMGAIYQRVRRYRRNGLELPRFKDYRPRKIVIIGGGKHELIQ